MKPTGSELSALLGSAAVLWSDIVHAVEETISPIDTVWKPSKAEFGRICLLQHKKRTLLYLTPEKEKGLAMSSSLPATIKKMFAEARPYAEGRGIRFPVISQTDVPTIKKLVEIKTAPK